MSTENNPLSAEDRAAFLSNPRAWLEGQGAEIAEGVEIVAVEDTPEVAHFVIPARPRGDLPEAEDPISKLYVRAWEDESFLERLRSSPREALASELGAALPESAPIKVLEDSATLAHVVVPPVAEGGDELSEDDLDAVAGGSTTGDVCGGIGIATGVLGLGAAGASKKGVEPFKGGGNASGNIIGKGRAKLGGLTSNNMGIGMTGIGLLAGIVSMAAD